MCFLARNNGATRDVESIQFVEVFRLLQPPVGSYQKPHSTVCSSCFGLRCVNLEPHGSEVFSSPPLFKRGSRFTVARTTMQQLPCLPSAPPHPTLPADPAYGDKLTVCD
jgi:hypothetical protein